MQIQFLSSHPVLLLKCQYGSEAPGCRIVILNVFQVVVMGWTATLYFELERFIYIRKIKYQ